MKCIHCCVLIYLKTHIMALIIMWSCLMEITKFFETEYVDYCSYDNYRSLGNCIDGLKPSSRKVLNTVRRNNIKKNIKVSILASDVTRENEYLHGNVSLEGVIIGMAQNFSGTNNINLLKPEGSFGNRCIQNSAASRYICTKKNDVVDYIFSELDDSILTQQEFEGSIIEPKFFIPIIPMILINGSEGIGNGFAQKILPRNPKDVISSIINFIKNGVKIKTLMPYYKGFNGSIDKNNDGLIIKGKFERVNTTTLIITELPIGYDLSKYNLVLSKLEDDKTILNYTDKSEGNTFRFEIKATREFIQKPDDWILDTLKLVKKVTENFTCIDENNSIKEFSNEVELLEYYITIRHQYYAKRKDDMLYKIKKELLILGSKFYFLKLVLSDNITVFKKSKKEVEEQIRSFTTKFPFHDEDGFGYLLNMPIHSFTSDTYEDLKTKIDEKKNQLTKLEEKSIIKMWLDDLNELEKMILY